MLCTGLFLCAMVAKGVAQAAPGVRHVYAFMTERQPGNIPVEPDGVTPQTGPDTMYTVYVETTGQDIQWKKAYVRGRVYTLSGRRVEKTPFEAGRPRLPGEKTLLQVGRGGRLWQLDLARASGKVEYNPRAGAGEIITLEGKRGNKKILLRINKVVELKGIPSV